jgi:class 3 adenylate cyclase
MLVLEEPLMSNELHADSTTPGRDDKPLSDGQQRLLDKLKSARTHDITSASELKVLSLLWRTRNEKTDSAAWNEGPEPYLYIAERFLKLGYASAAREVALVASEHAELSATGAKSYPWRDLPRLRILYARAHTQCKSPGAAQQILLRLYDEIVPPGSQTPFSDPELVEEILGNLGRTYKDQAAAPQNLESRKALFATARRYYTQAWDALKRYWTGINVATLAMLEGKSELARDMADKVRAVALDCLAAQKRKAVPPAEFYWELATLGEAELLLGNVAAAGEWYHEAHAAAPRNYGQLLSTRRQARWLLEHMQLDRELLDVWLPFPKVVVFAGHMVDHPDRAQPRLPATILPDVERAILDWLKEQNAVFGFSSGACGSDLIFQKAIHKLDGEACLVLPFWGDEFLRRSVARPNDPSGPGWSKRLAELCQSATMFMANSQDPFSHHAWIDFQFTTEVMLGMALLLSAEYETPLLGLSVWNGAPGDDGGGTADAVAAWQRVGIPVHCINPCSKTVPLRVVPVPPSEPTAKASSIRIKWPEEKDIENGIGTAFRALIFADAKGFGKLTNMQTIPFNKYFLKPIGDLLREKYAVANDVRNTWGDALYATFHSVTEAGCCALDIVDLVRRGQETLWEYVGLPRDLTIRIALHAGPVFTMQDPVTQGRTCCGTHVSRAARLEPSTPPGEVYASQTFAALAAAEQVTAFRCEFVKQLDWAKDYGAYPTYVVRRTAGVTT